MDPLTQALLQRQPQTPVVPPSGHVHVPPAIQRFQNAQALMQAYRNNWTPNPVLLQASQK